jgi:hypothetical protein
MFSLTLDAIDYVHEISIDKKEKPVIIIYQISKQACSGSYLDYYLELSSRKEKINTDLYERYEEIDDGYGENIPIYIEKRILSDFPETGEILIDIQKTQKFDSEFISLILKENQQ